MTPKELYELAKQYDCENEEMVLWDGETPWILVDHRVAIWETDERNAICIKEICSD